MKTNSTMCRTVPGAVHWVVDDAVDESVDVAVYGAVGGARSQAVYEAVYGTVGEAVSRDPPHHSTHDFLPHAGVGILCG